ncbi:MAG: glycosyltransferase family 2 protein [Proteobacteria bacterium]|nr:glycosyltransferase family 2 protein [Pseudomonadota bacterium]
MKLVVQIPCLNEAETLAGVIADVPRRIEGVDEVAVLVIDDGSTDATAEVAARAGADRVVRLETHRGLAAAFRTGLKAALDMGADLIVNTDGDHQYPGRHIPDLIRPLVGGQADLVIGARPFDRSHSMGRTRKLLQRRGSRWLSRRLGLEVKDATSGFRAMTRRAARYFQIMSDFTYTIETLLVARDKGLRVVSLPITVNPPTRPSRLFGSTLGYLWRTAETLIRISVFLNPFRYLMGLSLVFLCAGAALAVRWLVYWLVTPAGEVVGRTQSLLIGAVLILVGVLTVLFGVLADLTAKNRRLLEDVVERLHDLEKTGPRPNPGQDRD